jgi:hypothetical protein
MVKTHKITGLQYLCQTTRKDPFKYRGSGKYWKLHLDKHGAHIETRILVKCYTKSALKAWGIYYSDLWCVVESNKWANLKREEGDGGACGPEGIVSMSRKLTGRTKENHSGIAAMAAKKRGRTKTTDPSIASQASKMTGRTKETHPHLAEAGIKISIKLKGRVPANKGKTKETSSSVASMANKMSGRTKETHSGIATKAAKQRELYRDPTKNPRYDFTIYHFVHEDGREENLTQYDMRTKYDLSRTHLIGVIRGRSKVIKGWRIIRDAKYSNSEDDHGQEKQTDNVE